MTERKIRVLLVSNTLSCGGGERQITLIANALNATGDYDVDVLYYGQKDGAFASVLKKEPLFVDKDRLGALHTILAIRRILKTGKYDILHAAGGGTSNLYGRAAAILAKTPVILGMLRGKTQLHSFPIRIINSFLNLFCRNWSVNNPALVEILKKDLLFVREERVYLLYNSFASAQEVDYCIGKQTEYDVEPEGAFVFATVGRCVKVKNFPMYLRAAARICEKYEKARFWLIGDGPEQESLRALAQEMGIGSKVRFFGFRSDVDAALARIDVYVQSSDSEGTSNSVLEALRASLPVISTNNTDLTEILHDSVNGYLTPCRDEDALFEAMDKMISASDAELERMGKASSDLFCRTFLAENAICRWDSLYRALLSEKKLP